MAATKIKLLLILFVFVLLIKHSQRQFAVAKPSQVVVEAESPSIREEKDCYRQKAETCTKDWHCCTKFGCFISWCI